MQALKPPTNLPSRAPKKASSSAARMWLAPITERIQLLIDPKPETARDFIRAGIESFDVQDLARFIHEERDLVPPLKDWLALDNDTVRPWAQMVIRIWWPQVFAAAMDPAQILADIRAHDPWKAQVLDTPKGRIWFNATIYSLITFFRGYAHIEGDGVILPPPRFPERMRRKALRGAVRVMERVRGH